MLSYLNWLPVLSGGLAGAILTLVGQYVVAWWNRPILRVTFSQNESGCEVDTPAHVRAGDVVVANCQQRYLRLKVRNRGKSSAKNVSICVTEIAYTAAGAGATVFAEEVFDLKLALTADRAVFNLAGGGHRFIDLVHTWVCTPLPGAPPLPLPQAGCQARRDFDFLTSAVRLEDLNFTRGRYRMRVFVSAENAASSTDELGFSWDGTLHGLQIVAPRSEAAAAGGRP